MTIHYDPRAAEAKRQAALRDAFANAQPDRRFRGVPRLSERAYFWTLVTVVTLAAAFTLALT